MLKKYEIIRQIGRGTFSSVYEGKHRLTNEPVAIKTESIENECTLRHEGKILLYLAGTSGVPNVRAFGVEGHHRFLVMDFYEKSLNNELASKLNHDQKMYIFDTIIEIIKNIHDKKIIHRDIKPANFMLRRSKIFLIDFGLSTVFFDAAAPKKNGSTEIIGTPKYISTFIHEGYEPAPRDDFISAVYIGLFLWRDGELPWDKCGNNHVEIYNEKRRIEWRNSEKRIYDFYRNFIV